MQVSVLVSVLTLASTLIGLRYEFKAHLQIYRYFVMIVSIFSVNVAAVMFINLAVLMKVCFARINTCLCELIQCAGQELVGLYRQVPTVKHQQTLIQFTLVLAIFYCVTFVYVTYCGVTGIMNVKNRHVGGVMWIMLNLAGTVLNAVLFTVLTQSCSSATCAVRRCINVLYCIDTVLQQRHLCGKALYKCALLY